MSSPNRPLLSQLGPVIRALSRWHIGLPPLLREQAVWLSALDRNRRRLLNPPAACLPCRPVNLVLSLRIPLLHHRLPLLLNRMVRATSNMCKPWSMALIKRIARPLSACPGALLNTDTALLRLKHRLVEQCHRSRLLVVHILRHPRCIRLTTEWAMHRHRHRLLGRFLLYTNGRQARVRWASLHPRRLTIVSTAKGLHGVECPGHYIPLRTHLARIACV